MIENKKQTTSQKLKIEERIKKLWLQKYKIEKKIEELENKLRGYKHECY